MSEPFYITTAISYPNGPPHIGHSIVAQRYGVKVRRITLWFLGGVAELTPGPTFRQTEEGRLLGHVHLGLRLVEERAGGLQTDARTELLHAISCHHDARAARTAEAAVLYHANQLDAVAATRPIPD